MPGSFQNDPAIWRGPIPGTHERGFVEQPIVRADVDTSIFEIPVELFEMGDCRIILAHEPAGWHLSISCADRHPSWDEIKTARYRLLPLDLTFGLPLPPLDQYVNLPQQDHVFHLWEFAEPD